MCGMALLSVSGSTTPVKRKRPHFLVCQSLTVGSLKSAMWNEISQEHEERGFFLKKKGIPNYRAQRDKKEIWGKDTGRGLSLAYPHITANNKLF